MLRSFPIILVSLMVSGSFWTELFAQERKASAQEPKATTINLTVKPAGEPVPALQYRFRRTVDTLVEGDPTEHFRRIVAKYESIEVGDQKYKYLRNMWEQLEHGDPKEMRPIIAQYESLFEPIHQFALCTFPEHVEYEHHTVSDYLDRFYVECVVSRELSYLLRMKVANSESVQESVELITDGMRLADYNARGSSIIHQLIGNAIYQQMFAEVRRLIERYPDVNLYWALSTVQRPLIRYANSVSNDMGELLELIPDLSRERLSVTGQGNEFWVQQYRSMMDRVEEILKKMAGESPARSRFLMALMLRNVGFYRTHLRDYGYSGDRLKDLEEAQIVMLATRIEFEKATQCLEKMPFLELPAVDYVVRPENQLFDNQLDKMTKDYFPACAMLGLFAFKVQVCFDEGAQAEVELHRLITLEAIRMFVAKHGQLPESLEDLDVVPALHNPLTKQPFEYKVEPRAGNQQRFTLSAPVVASDSKTGPLRVTMQFD